MSDLIKHIPPGQFGRYLAVGVCNTAFAYASYALFTALLDRYIPASYMAASMIASVLNITVSFLGYKLTRFCPRCGFTVHRTGFFSRVQFCPRCGCKLEDDARP